MQRLALLLLLKGGVCVCFRSFSSLTGTKYRIGTGLRHLSPLISTDSADSGEDHAPSTTKGLADIANLCAKDVVQKTVKFTDKNWFAGLSTDSITNLTVNEVPMVYKSGQHVVIVKKVPLVVQYDKDNTSITDILLNGSKVALVGHPGVGKSTELNIILVDLFRALMDGRITVLFHRVELVLYSYRSEKEGVKFIACDQVGGAGDSLLTLKYYLRDKGFDDMPTNNPSAVLVLELDEMESGSNMKLPTLLAISLRDVMTELKTWWKDDSLEVSIRPTHTHEELLVLATALFQSSGKPQFLRNLGLPSTTSSVDDAHQIVKQRMEI
ncbi:hypothetical protein B484DRAFT_470998, partial [Ochromonadaceae sp. CCMP2298]